MYLHLKRIKQNTFIEWLNLNSYIKESFTVRLVENHEILLVI